MTHKAKKIQERIFAEQAAKHLGELWTIGADREHPDFIITSDGKQFGLEITQMFTGLKGKSGSQTKKQEAETQRAVNNLRRTFENKVNIPLHVRFLGNMCGENMDAVLPALYEIDLPGKLIGYQDRVEIHRGDAPLCLDVTRALRSDWYSVNDRVGWVNHTAESRIDAAIVEKSSKLPLYRRLSGLNDICLLIVANRIMNSGKLVLRGRPVLKLAGFQVVYFLSYPNSVTVLGSP